MRRLNRLQSLSPRHKNVLLSHLGEEVMDTLLGILVVLRDKVSTIRESDDETDICK